MPAPVTVDLSGSYGYAGDAPVGINLSNSGYADGRPVSVPMAGAERALHIPQTVTLPGVRNGADHAGLVHYDGEVVHYDGEAATV